MSYTQEQVNAEFAKSQERVRPAVLADSHLNGALVSDYILANGLEPTADNFYTAVNALVGSLQWIVKPAKLQAGERNEKPAKIENPLLLEADRARAIKAVEAAAADAKATAAAVAKAKEIIAGYAPARNSARGGTIDYTNQAKYQRYWSDLLNNVEKNVAVVVADRNHIPGKEDGGHAITVSDAQSFVIWLAKDRDHQYALQERRRERM